MKKILILFTLILFSISVYCQKNSQLAGAWEMIYQQWGTADTTVERTHFEHPSIKVLSEKYFSFCAESGRGHSGKYFYDGKTYTETIKFSYNQSLINQTTEFKSKIEDNNWHIEGLFIVDDREVLLKETWQRLD